MDPKEERASEAARCALLCVERANSHRRTMAHGTGDRTELGYRASEADKCAVTIASGKAPDGDPVTILAEIRATALADREKLRMERDRANQAYAELHTSHRALTAARDENAARILQMRDTRFAVDAVVLELEERVANLTHGDPQSPALQSLERERALGYQGALDLLRKAIAAC